MPITSIMTHRMNMQADILKQGQFVPDPIDPEKYGEWIDEQDPLTGEIVRVWRPFPDNPVTPDVDENVTFGVTKCLVRGIMDGGVRVGGTNESFGTTYENLEFLKMWVPTNVTLTKRDRVTNIRNSKGQILWLDEEFQGVPKATVFNINGVIPLFDPFNKHIENFVVLERADNLDEGDV